MVGAVSYHCAGVERGAVYNYRGTGFHYRIPEHSTIVIREGDTPRAEARMLVNQYGITTWLPPHEMEIEFYPNTGSIKSVGRIRNQ